jgi:integrase
VKTTAHYTMGDAMDIALLTGQRLADVLKFRRADIRDGALWIVQNKTGVRISTGLQANSQRLSTEFSTAPARPSALIWFRMRTASR